MMYFACAKQASKSSQATRDKVRADGLPVLLTEKTRRASKLVTEQQRQKGSCSLQLQDNNMGEEKNENIINNNRRTTDTTRLVLRRRPAAMMPPMLLPRRRRQRTAVLLLSLLLFVFFSASTSSRNTALATNPRYDNDDGDSDNDDDNGGDEESDSYDDASAEEHKTEHERLREALRVDDVDDGPRRAAKRVLQSMTAGLEDRLTALFAATKTPECRAKIAQHVAYFVDGVGKEEALPFTDVRFRNECPEPVYDDWDNLPEGMHVGHVQNRTYRPLRNETKYVDDPSELQFCYGILTHDDAPATIRLVEALHEPGHSFVVHVDGKSESDGVYRRLVEYAADKPHVHVLDSTRRVPVNWGGFSMVNATMQLLRYAFAVGDDGEEDGCRRRPIEFHKFFHVAASCYPLASNREIRNRMAEFPVRALFLLCGIVVVC